MLLRAKNAIAFLALLISAAFGDNANGQVFDFETSGQFEASPLTAGDFANFEETTSRSLSGAHSLHFVDRGPGRFESFTYDDPTSMSEGVITVWFYDTSGFPAVGNPSAAQWGMSIILEDADNPADFGAIEICDLPYGNQGYYASEGVGDRLKPADRFYSGLPGPRAIGWHRVDFEVSTTITMISVDGATALEVAAPGGNKRLRLRIMADSASVGGFDNWFTFTGNETWPAKPAAIYVDDISFSESAPIVETKSLNFDVTGSVPDYDTIGEFMGPVATNIPEMRGFVNTFDITTSATHSGAQAAYFAHGTPAFRNVSVNLTGLSRSTTQTITLSFYDSLGADQGFDKIGGSVILESGLDPRNFIALEIWNAPYPFAGPVPNYYLVARPIPSGSGFFSGYFGDRSVGWHTVEIILMADASRIKVDGIENANGAGLILGPGLNDNLRLRIMADSPSLGGFNNWQDPTAWTDPQSPELDTLYLIKDAPYLYFDDLAIPASINAAESWMTYP